jgi:hypothetical protein
MITTQQDQNEDEELERARCRKFTSTQIEPIIFIPTTLHIMRFYSFFLLPLT